MALRIESVGVEQPAEMAGGEVGVAGDEARRSSSKGRQLARSGGGPRVGGDEAMQGRRQAKVACTPFPAGSGGLARL